MGNLYIVTQNQNSEEAEKAKKEELARKKAEREALEAAEAASLPSRAGPKKAKAAPKKTKGLDLSQLDGDDNMALPALNATGIENALDALSVAGGSDAKVDKHPERRFKAAYAQFEQRRLSEMEKDGSGVGLRQNQKQMKIKKEFEKSPENPFNQMTARYDATKEELEDLKKQEKTKIEKTLAEQN
ncbi:hypothetical protein B0T26DRAFT_210391 [Lasiosphaeria miniovina]|uniref:Coiled-coil domain-containing protein n=1 Tax=Lasiosphaeria miniovina TaxID=1954250 RepID=A0AA40E302_9PEZI|nr:uncharacterized protein B0T26DRAFT_210391 [Lasiosphaeria miniovina]KAK0722256.1 hypothetical protein B0T26DRAFT_210391 [Lasiosphaeria miniovina]